MDFNRPQNGEDRTVALRYTRIHENAIHTIGTNLSYSAMKVYLYINFNCNLASGITHPAQLLTDRRVLGDYAQECLSRGRGNWRARG